MTEFTGERVIPGQVNDDLWAEHVARYAFAARFARGKRVLDAGCGTGYGCAELARSASFVAGIDIAADAVSYGRRNGAPPNAAFAQASAACVPFGSASFDLVTAFEVIEHLENWRDFLEEIKRVLRRQGLFLVSTPNRLYYAESRAGEGPNPYHVHEFEFDEVKAELSDIFKNVTILFQNRLESFAFNAESPAPSIEAQLGIASATPSEAHFFIAACSMEPLPDLPDFVYVPRAANMLRERERHIRMLECDLQRLIAEHQSLQNSHEELTSHLEKQNRWALDLDNRWKAAQQRIVQVQNELQSEQAKAAKVIDHLQEENRIKTQWALDTEARLTADLVERTEWAQRLDAQVRELEAQLE
ncbi:MAG TPA: methyltransferase domain-containing protein, partial [Bryobacteraceae bacterium]|nr:methyltransferase domain-containing protein [Bryobacteraceae bacterium]